MKRVATATHKRKTAPVTSPNTPERSLYADTAATSNATVSEGADKRERLTPVLLSADEIEHLFETLPQCCPDCADIMTTASVARADLRGGGPR